MRHLRRWTSAALLASAAATGPVTIYGQLNDAPQPPQLLAPGGGNADAVADDESAEVYTRGPLHEAFAQPIGASEGDRPIIAKTPPAVIDELPPDERPDGNNVEWIPGYWGWDDTLNDYLWISGLWRDVPPGRRWVPGYWHQLEGGFTRVPGMWLSEEREALNYLPAPPESLEQGPSSPQPDDSSFWVPGHWVYVTHDYQWRPGRWAPFAEDWVWVPAHYDWTPLGYVFVEGYWDYEPQDRGLVFAPVYFHGPYVRPYTPVTVINTWDNFLVNLFVSPRYGWYTFGDYYGTAWQTRAVLPLYSFHGHRRGYDPLFVHYNHMYGNTFVRRLQGWHDYYVKTPDRRPAPTWRKQREWQRDHGHDHDHDRFGNSSILAANLRDLSRERNVPFRLASVNREDRNRFVERSRDFNQFTQNRVRFEREQPKPGDKRGAANGPRPTFDLPKSPSREPNRTPRLPGEITRNRDDSPAGTPRFPSRVGDEGRPERTPQEGGRPGVPDRENPLRPDRTPVRPDRTPGDAGERPGRDDRPSFPRPGVVNEEPGRTPRDPRTGNPTPNNPGPGGDTRNRRERLFPDFPGNAPGRDRDNDRTRPDGGRPENRGRAEQRPEPMPQPKPEDRRVGPQPGGIPSPTLPPGNRPSNRTPMPERTPPAGSGRTPGSERGPTPNTSNFGPRPNVPSGVNPGANPGTPRPQNPTTPRSETPAPQRPNVTPRPQVPSATPKTQRPTPNPGAGVNPATPRPEPRVPRVDPRPSNPAPSGPGARPSNPKPNGPAARPSNPTPRPSGPKPSPRPNPPSVKPPAAPPAGPPAAPGGGRPSPGEKKGKK